MKIGVLLILLLFGLHSAYPQQNCVLRKDNDGVKVYLCDNASSAFKTIIVELEVPATLAQYAAKVLDIENYYRWQDRVSEQKVLLRVSETELFYYSLVDVPWPVSDRDYIFHLNMHQDIITKVVTMTLSEVPNFIPHREDIVRVPYAESTLTLTPIDATNLNVRYELAIDPGGEVPAWLINIFAASTPWNTFHSFREQIITQGENRQEVDFILNYE